MLLDEQDFKKMKGGSKVRMLKVRNSQRKYTPRECERGRERTSIDPHTAYECDPSSKQKETERKVKPGRERKSEVIVMKNNEKGLHE